MIVGDASGEPIGLSRFFVGECGLLGYEDTDLYKECCILGAKNPGYSMREIKEMVRLKQQDIQDCLDFPTGSPRLSASGKLCIIWNPNDDKGKSRSPSVDKYARAHGGIPYVSFCDKDTCDAQNESDLVGKIVVGSMHMYVMRFAYEEAKRECSRRGGTLTLKSGQVHENSYILCKIEATTSTMTQEECDAMQTSWPLGYADGNIGTFRITGNKVKCSYLPTGLILYGGRYAGPMHR